MLSKSQCDSQRPNSDGPNLIKKLLESKEPTQTDVSRLPDKIRNAVSNLPNLNFMRSKVLMFPVRDVDL